MKYVIIQWVEVSDDLESLIAKAEELEETTDKHTEIWSIGEVNEYSWLEELAWD